MEPPKQTPFYKKQGLRRYIGPKRIILLLVFSCCALVAWHLWKKGLLTPQAVFGFIVAHPVLAPVLFVCVYVVFTLFLIPSLPLNLGAGLLWGPLLGSLFTLAGSVTGTCTAFLLARTALGQPLAEHFDNALVRSVQEEIEEKGWRAVAFMCVNPVVPPGPLGCLFGLTSLRLTTYLWATAIFLFPPVLAFATIGHISGTFVLEGDFKRLFQLVAAVSGTIVMLVIIRVVGRRLSKNRRAKLSQKPVDVGDQASAQAKPKD